MPFDLLNTQNHGKRGALLVPASPLRVRREHWLADRLVSAWVWPNTAGAGRSGLYNIAPGIYQEAPMIEVGGTSGYSTSGQLGPGYFPALSTGLSRQWDSTSGSQRTVPFDPGGSGGHQPFTIAAIGQFGSSSNIYAIYCLRAVAADAYLAMYFSSSSTFEGAVRGSSAVTLVENTTPIGAGDPFLAILTTRSTTDHELRIRNLRSGGRYARTASGNVGSATSGNRILGEQIGCQFNTSSTYQFFADAIIHACFSWDRGFYAQEMDWWCDDPLGMLEEEAPFFGFPIAPGGGGGGTRRRRTLAFGSP